MKINIKSLFFIIIISCNISNIVYALDVSENLPLPPLPNIENNATINEQSNLTQIHQTESNSILQRIKNIFKSNKQKNKQASSVKNTAENETLPQLPQVPEVQNLNNNQISSQVNSLLENKDTIKSIENDSNKQFAVSPVSVLAQPATTQAVLLSRSTIQKHQTSTPVAANNPTSSVLSNITNKIDDIKRVEEPKIMIQKTQNSGIDKLKAAMSRASTAALQQETETSNKAKAQVPLNLSTAQKPVSLLTVPQAASSQDNARNTQENITMSNEDPIFSLGDNNDMSGLQAQFITNEAKVLLLPSDDVVLGQLSPGAKIENTDFLSYVDTLDQQSEQPISQNDRLIKNFLLNYHYNFDANQILTNSEAKEAAFEAISQNNLPALKVLIDNYQILQAVDYNGNSLLHHAVDLNLYHVSKFLLIRGVNITTKNYNFKTALTIAQSNNYRDIISLIQNASMK